jgi:hypothetical protein
MIIFNEEVIDSISRIIAERTGPEITDFFRMAGFPEIIHDGSTKFRFVREQLNNLNNVNNGSQNIKRIIEKLVHPKLYIGMEEYHQTILEKVNNSLYYNKLTIDQDYKIVGLTDRNDFNFSKKIEGIIDLISSNLGRISGEKKVEKFFPNFFQSNPNLITKSKQEKIAALLKVDSWEDFKNRLQTLIDYHTKSFDRERVSDFNNFLKPINLKIDSTLKLERIQSIIETPSLSITSEIVQKAIDDAKTLIEKNGATSGIDRIHTALHGYLKAICEKEQIIISVKNPKMHDFFKAIIQDEKLKIDGNRKIDIERIIYSMANILDALNPIRNMASVAHPNDSLLDEDEAILVINTAQTLLHYINSKFKL